MDHPTSAAQQFHPAPDTLSHVLAVLAELLGDGQPLRVEIEHGGMRAVLSVAPCALAPSLSDPPNETNFPHPRGREFSPIEEAIIRVMKGADGWMTKAEIAGACGHSVSSWFSYALANLADREYLESGRNGYRLRQGQGAASIEPVAQLLPEQRGRQFSPVEEAILAVMTKEWQNKVLIAEACKMPMSSQFCALLTNLVDREFLESGHKGYRLNSGSQP